mmetsp:Transcript_18525/g.39642  ORF Transcript_18525/g.39642 Transcript_18525/m.39642 type:complete len:230 (-) Transcript_18525:1079-1768(-)
MYNRRELSVSRRRLQRVLVALHRIFPTTAAEHGVSFVLELVSLQDPIQQPLDPLLRGGGSLLLLCLVVTAAVAVVAAATAAASCLLLLAFAVAPGCLLLVLVLIVLLALACCFGFNLCNRIAQGDLGGPPLSSGDEGESPPIPTFHGDGTTLLLFSQQLVREVCGFLRSLAGLEKSSELRGPQPTRRCNLLALQVAYQPQSSSAVLLTLLGLARREVLQCAAEEALDVL